MGTRPRCNRNRDGDRVGDEMVFGREGRMGIETVGGGGTGAGTGTGTGHLSMGKSDQAVAGVTVSPSQVVLYPDLPKCQVLSVSCK